MSRWKSVKAKQLLAVLLRIGRELAWKKDSHIRARRLPGTLPVGKARIPRRHPSL
jgi:hypothetical protein